MKRIVIQIATSVSIAASGGTSGTEERIIALCNDGTMWDLCRWYDSEERKSRSKWKAIASIPQITTKDVT